MPTEPSAALAAIAVATPTIAQWRQAALVELRSHVRFEAALFHELSPRVPLSRAGVIGLELARLAATTKQWDDHAVSLAPLMHTALAQHGVATDREAFGVRGAARTRWNRLVARPLGIRAASMAHLVVDERIISAVLLMRRRDPPFSTRERLAITALVPVLTLGDAYHLARAQPSLPGLVTGVRCVDERLTPRQREVVEYVALGRTNAEIGAALGTSIHTVRNLLVRVCARLGAANRAEVVRLAVLHPQRS
ncbi:MAG: helix-turn-helix transcriptional regulator [Myxococcales bacterium]|nr:helix-turn-helix transcriptional regulator [Myxococcales bacterium]